MSFPDFKPDVVPLDLLAHPERFLTNLELTAPAEGEEDQVFRYSSCRGF